MTNPSTMIIVLLQSANNDANLGCIAILVIALIVCIAVIVQRLQRQQKLKKAKEHYFSALDFLKTDPTNADLRQETLNLGRKYSEITRQINHGNKSLAIYDEVALMNDINAACAAAAAQISMPKTSSESIEERLIKLSKLKENALIDEYEYQERRNKILDEI